MNYRVVFTARDRADALEHAVPLSRRLRSETRFEINTIMPDDAPTSDDILRAMKATGLLMEQRVATCVESLGFRTWTGYPFADPEESKSRKIDVRGYRQFRIEDTTTTGKPKTKLDIAKPLARPKSRH